MKSLVYPCVNFPVVSFVVDWKLLLLLDCDELCTTLTKMITAIEMNLMIFFFFNFNFFLLPISYDFRVIDFYQCPGCVYNFKLAVMAKVRGIFF